MTQTLKTLPLQTRVHTREGNGIVVGLSVWTANETDQGDRTVLLDSGERLHFESFLMRALPMQTQVERIDDAGIGTAVVLSMGAIAVIEMFTNNGFDVIGVPANDAVDMLNGDVALRITKVS